MKSNRLGCLTFTGMGAALITLVLITGIGLAQGGSMFSPGALNAQNVLGASIGGVNSHADLKYQCGACHTAPWSSVSMTDQCLACHTEIEAELQSKATLHGSVLEFMDPIQCRDCHSEHLGPESLLTSFDTSFFKHDVVGFSLEGHQTTYNGRDFACEDCHTNGGVRFEVSTCGSCHFDADPAFVQMHTADFGMACLDCHDGIDTYGDTFDHAQTGFPLLGDHQEALCRDCHDGARSIADLQSAPTTCFDCHSKDDAHDGQFGQNCGVCHTPDDWERTSFDHSMTNFPLVGQHEDLDCQECHANNAFVGTPQECAACHQDVNPHGDLFTLDCGYCHTPVEWDQVTFDHPMPEAQDCRSCHTADVPQGHFPGQCSDCHTPDAWTPASFDHASAQATDCVSCHQSDAPPNHFPGQCSECHTTDAWSPSTFSHETAVATDCIQCHSKDAPPNHFPGQCSACHTTQGWLPADFDHEVAGATDCVECHLADRPPNHYSGQCSACHSTQAWLPADFNHSVAGATNCLECHADDAPPNHYSGQCSACHNTDAWLPANFNHAAAGATNCISCHLSDRPPNHYEGQCSMCHTTDAWLPASFNHTFPTNHGGAGGVCDKCHPNGPPGYTCYTCHNQQEIKKKHQEEGISDFSDCVACHPDGRKGGD